VTEKLPDVWTTRDFPVLLEVARQVDQGSSRVPAETVAEATGLSVDDVDLAGAALQRRGLVSAKGAWGRSVLWFDGVSGEAYLLTGLHPSGDDAVSALVDALRQAAELVEDPQEKSRLHTLADNALGVGRDVLGGVLVNLATKGMLG
jgi:hypothetical protein